MINSMLNFVIIYLPIYKIKSFFKNYYYCYYYYYYLRNLFLTILVAESTHFVIVVKIGRISISTIIV